MTCKTFILIAWRNVRRNGRRSFLTVLIAGMGLATLIISNSLYDGFHEKMIENAVRVFMGHIQIHSDDFHRNPTVDKYFELSDKELIEGIPYIKAFSKRVKFQALASTSTNSQAVMAIGIEAGREKDVTILERSVLEGEYLDGGDKNIHSCLVGEFLFENLRMELGEKLVLMSQSFDGSLSADAFRVSGICRTGNPDIDRSFVWIPLAAAQAMLNYGDNVSEVVLFVERSDRVDYVKNKISERVSGRELEVLSWKEIAPDIVQLIALDVAMQRILMTIISLIVAVAVMNAMLMSIHERFTEFGIMSAIGTRPGQIVGMVLWESFFLGMLGILCGIIITLLGMIYFCNHGVNLSSFSAGVSRFIGLETRILPVVKWRQVVLSSLFILASSTIISIFPALKAAHMDTIKTIRHI
ncbi:MAG TPA: ABC transporter permease [bacterium]|nr:ABC transporter permease [bacterium]